MKKILTLMLLLPTAVMTISGAAQAQRKNTTSHDVKPKTECVCDGKSEKCPCLNKAEDIAKKHHKDKKDHKHKDKKEHGHKDKKEHKEHDAKGKKTYIGEIDGWVIEQNEKIAEDYRKFIKKINKSELDKETSTKLQKMADANSNAAKKHVADTAALIKKNHQDCMNLVKDGHKLCKRLDKMLLSQD